MLLHIFQSQSILYFDLVLWLLLRGNWKGTKKRQISTIILDNMYQWKSLSLMSRIWVWNEWNSCLQLKLMYLKILRLKQTNNLNWETGKRNQKQIKLTAPFDNKHTKTHVPHVNIAFIKMFVFSSDTNPKKVRLFCLSDSCDCKLELRPQKLQCLYHYRKYNWTNVHSDTYSITLKHNSLLIAVYILLYTCPFKYNSLAWFYRKSYGLYILGG